MDRLARQRKPEHLQTLTGSRGSLAAIDAEARELLVPIAGGHAEVEPPTGEHVDDGGVLGQPDRVVERQEHAPWSRSGSVLVRAAIAAATGIRAGQ